MIQERKKFQPTESENILNLYNSLVSEGHIDFPITEKAQKNVDALCYSVNNSHFGKEIYASPEEKSVAYMYFIIKDHPFTDGNKRTSVATFLRSCEINNLPLRFFEIKEEIMWELLSELTIFIEEEKTEKHQEAIKFLVSKLFKNE